MVHAHGTDDRTVSDVNQQIDNILASNGIALSGSSDEALWNAIEEVQEMNASDAVDLANLACVRKSLQEHARKGLN